MHAPLPGMPGWKPPAASGASGSAPVAPTCPRCGYTGAPHCTSHGGPGGCLVVLLFCLGILPGVLYLLFASSVEMRHCPQCGAFLGQSSGSGCLTALAVTLLGLAAIGALLALLGAFA